MKIRLLICIFLLLFLVRGYSQNCTLSVSLSSSEPVICSGNSIALTAATTAGTAPYKFVWSTGQTSQTININKAGIYNVTVTDNTPGCQPVVRTISVTTALTPDAPTAKGATVCPNSTATLTATAPGGNYQWYDAAGNFLANGASYTPPDITNSSTFYVQTTIGGCTSSRTPVNLNLNGKPTVTGAVVCQGNVTTLLATGGDTFAWYATAAATGTPLNTEANFTTPVLETTTTYYVVVTSNGCTSNPTPVTATVTPKPQPPAVSNQTVCSGTTVNLHADAPSGILNWYNTPSGGIPLISSPDYTTPVLTSTTTYYVENAINDCVSNRIPVVVTVNPHPQAPGAQTDSVCYQSSATLTAGTNTSLTYKWYDAATGGNLLTTGAAYTTPALTESAIYYVESINGGCQSDRTPISVIVKPLLSAPSASGVIVCHGESATLMATSDGGTYQWYDAATAGKLVSANAAFNIPALTATTTYYVQRTSGGCISQRTPVTVTVLALPQSPSATGTSVCSGSPAILSALSTTDVYAWYNSATGGNLLSSAQVFVTPPLTATTIYYVQTANINDCASTRTPVTVTVYPIPQAPATSNVTTCLGTAATLTASASSGELQWYSSATGGNMLTTGNTYVTPVLKANTTYYVQNTIGECTGPRKAVTVTVKALIEPQFAYPSGTECTSSTNPVPVIFNPAGGTFSASPAGLVFVNPQTGAINIAASTPGTYLISFTGNDQCSHTSTAKFSVLSNFDPHFTYSSPFCQDGNNPGPLFQTGASGGTFSSVPAGLVFISTSTGEINLSQSKPGTYTITNTIAPSGSCPMSTASTTVTINQGVTVVAGPTQTILQGTPVQLAGSISGGGISTGKWSGGTGSFSDPASLNAIYTPGPGETKATLTLLSNDPAAPCGPQADIVTINFIPPPAAPSVVETTICDGTNTTLAATAPGGNYEWFTTATGTQVLATGPTFTTLWLTKTTTFYVQTTIKGFTSARTPVTVNVVPEPAAPTAAATQTCKNKAAILTAHGSTGNYTWYDSPAGGNLLSVDSTYVTPQLLTNTSYYVQARTNNCVSTRTKVDVTVTAIPTITSATSNIICSGEPLNYNILSNLANTNFSWSRAAVNGISNPAMTNQTSVTINETLINTTSNPLNVIYSIIPLNGSCPGAAFNYTVTVNPLPVITSPNNATICNYNTDDYQIQFSTAGAGYSWKRAMVPGISNAAVSGQNSNIIKEVLFNTSNIPVVVPYIINYQTNSCGGIPFQLNITVNPTAIITSDDRGSICSGTAQSYAISANIPSTTYTWSRLPVNNISNSPVSNQTSNIINETLINTSSNSINVIYKIVPQAYGCNGTTFYYAVTVNPKPNAPVANSNSPVCVGSTIQLRTVPVKGVTYLWTGPNGKTWSTQNVDIDNASAEDGGTYSLVLISAHGCPGPPVNDTVKVNSPGIAIAGPDQNVCMSTPYVTLSGSIKGGPATGLWSTAGTGTFSSNNNLNAMYTPSAADKAVGSVVLTLSSASPDNCAISSSSMTIKFGPVADAIAGPDQEVCSQETTVKLAGTLLTPLNVQWSTSGTGTFSADTQPNATYIPSAADEKSGQVTLKLSVINGGPCYLPSDTMTLKFESPPKLNSGGIVYVLKDKTTTLNPVVNENDLTYLWSPNSDINDINTKNPVITGDVDRFYTLTVTDKLGCQTTDTTYVKVSPEINITNTFTPNGDGINDTWELTGLQAYTQATVDIFNRYGQKIFHSLGYPKAWDGTYNGSPLPSGVYYYIIDTKYNNLKFSGDITIVR
jgi:gliding motility-associated-like protein